jgi:hypothetical protein
MTLDHVSTALFNSQLHMLAIHLPAFAREYHTVGLLDRGSHAFSSQSIVARLCRHGRLFS